MKSEIFFLAIYFTEAVLKITSKGFFFGKGAYLKDNWNKLDLFVVVAGYKTKFLFIYQSIYMYHSNNEFRKVDSQDILYKIKIVCNLLKLK